MSITLKVEPQRFQPVYNEIICVLSSDKSGEPSFQFVVDINIDGVYSSRKEQSTNLEGYGIIDIHKNIEPFVTFNLDYDGTDAPDGLWSQILSSYTKYDVTLYEQYVGPLSATSVSSFAGKANFNFGQEHGLVVGDRVTISGSSEATYNVSTIVVSTLNAFVFESDITYVSNSPGAFTRNDGGTTLFDSSVVFTGDKFAQNTSMSWYDYATFDDADFRMISSLPYANILSAIPDKTVLENYDVKIDDRMWANLYNNTSTQFARKLYVVTNNGSYKLENNTYTASTDSTAFLQVGIGPWNIENYSGTVDIVSGSLPMIDSTTEWYEVKVLGYSDSILTKNYKFNLNHDCSNFDNYKFIYMDIYGGFNSINFELASKKKTNVKRKTYKKNYGTYNSTTNSWGYDVSDRGTKHLDSDITKITEVSTNWINENTVSRIEDLILSPEVYHLDGSILRAVNITTNNIPIKTRKTDGLIQYSVNFEYAQKNAVQRG